MNQHRGTLRWVLEKGCFCLQSHDNASRRMLAIPFSQTNESYRRQQWEKIVAATGWTHLWYRGTIKCSGYRMLGTNGKCIVQWTTEPV